MTDETTDLKSAEKTAAEHGDSRPNMGWIPGLVLIAIGVLFLLGNLTGFQLRNWWALFILIPAFGSLGAFWRAWRSTGRVGHDARGSLIMGLIMLFVVAVFVFGWSWTAVWPFFLIIAGVGALLSALLD